MDSALECRWEGFRFWRSAECAAAAAAAAARGAPARPHIVSATAFRFAAAYQPSHKYAALLQRLCEAVRSHLPAFTLRLYCDQSLDPRLLQAQCEQLPQPAAEEAQRTAQAWRRCFDALAASGCVEVVWWEHAGFAARGAAAAAVAGGGHANLFGTLVRFLPLFATQLPRWCGSPPDGATVFVSDVDFHDFTTDHVMLHFVRWFSGAAAAAPPGAGAGAAAPELACVSYAGSSAPRHQPTCGMPPFIANCLATRLRFPGAWFTDYFADVRRVPAGASLLQGRFCREIHAPANQNFTYFKRKMDQQPDFPYGIDEFMLTVVLKGRAVARAGAPPAHWLFVILPNIDMMVMKALLLAGDAMPPPAGGSAAAVDLAANPVLARLVNAAAACAGRPLPIPAAAAASAAAASPPLPATLAKQWVADGWHAEAATRYGTYGDFCGAVLPALDAAQCSVLSRDLLALCSAMVDAMASGAVAHRGEDLAQALENLGTMAALAPRVIGTASFAVGEGQWRALGHGTPSGEALLACLQAELGEDCRVGRAGAAGKGVGEVYWRGTGAPGGQGVKRGREGEGGAGAGAGGGGGGGGAAAPPSFPGWALCVSRSKGMHYYTREGGSSSGGHESVWHDPGLPLGWAWGQAAPSAPRFYVNLVSGERREAPPDKE